MSGIKKILFNVTVYLFNGGKREESAWSQGCFFIPFILILSVYSVFKDLRLLCGFMK